VIPENEARQLIERLERHTRRSRPFLVYGLVAILIGFAGLTWHVNSLRAAAEAEAADLRVKKAALNRKLDQAGWLAGRKYSAADAPKALARISDLLADASETTREIDDGTDAAAAHPVAAASHQPDAVLPAKAPVQAPQAKEAPAPKPEAAGTPQASAVVRIFLHIVGKGQFAGAKELQWALTGATLDGQKVVVPGIELVDGADDTIRCLKPADCDRAARVAALVNAKLRGRSLQVRNLSRTYGDAPNVRPGTYEVWLAPGPVLVSAQ
jgi:hypothetical protein